MAWPGIVSLLKLSVARHFSDTFMNGLALAHNAQELNLQFSQIIVLLEKDKHVIQ